MSLRRWAISALDSLPSRTYSSKAAFMLSLKSMPLVAPGCWLSITNASS